MARKQTPCIDVQFNRDYVYQIDGKQIEVKAGDIAVCEVGEPFFQENAKDVELAMVRRLTGAQIKRWHRCYRIFHDPQSSNGSRRAG